MLFIWSQFVPSLMPLDGDDFFFSYLTDFSYFPLAKIFRKVQDTHNSSERRCRWLQLFSVILFSNQNHTWLKIINIYVYMYMCTCISCCIKIINIYVYMYICVHVFLVVQKTWISCLFLICMMYLIGNVSKFLSFIKLDKGR